MFDRSNTNAKCTVFSTANMRTRRRGSQSVLPLLPIDANQVSTSTGFELRSKEVKDQVERGTFIKRRKPNMTRAAWDWECKANALLQTLDGVEQSGLALSKVSFDRGTMEQVIVSDECVIDLFTLLASPDIRTEMMRLKNEGLEWREKSLAKMGDIFDLLHTKDIFNVDRMKLIFGFFLQLLTPIAFLETNNLVHRDVKPENILVADDGTLRLTDYDLMYNKKGTEGNLSGGTEFYMPIEYFDGRYFDKRLEIDAVFAQCLKGQDVWAAGMCAYIMIFLQFPYEPIIQRENGIFKRDSYNQWAQKVEGESRANIAQAKSYSEVVMLACYKCFEPDPNKRISATELKEALLEWQCRHN